MPVYRPGMLGDPRDDDFHRQWEHQYWRSVYPATAAVYERMAGGPPEGVYVALSLELQNAASNRS